MRLVLGAVLITILAGSAHAQSASASAGPTGTPPSPTPAVADGASPAPGLTPPSATPPVPPPPPDTPRVTLRPAGEVVVGGLLGTAGLFGGAFAGFAVNCALGCPGDFGGLEGVLIGAALGLSTATAVGVVLAGSDRDHTGSFGWAWLGAAAGGTVAGLAAARVHSEMEALVIVTGGAALGATIGFELTRTRSRPRAAVRLVPLITSGGVQLALVGAR